MQTYIPFAKCRLMLSHDIIFRHKRATSWTMLLLMEKFVQLKEVGHEHLPPQS